MATMEVHWNFTRPDRRFLFGLLLAVAVAILTPSGASCQGVLQQLRDDVRAPSSDSTKEKKPKECKRRRPYNDDDEATDSFFAALMAPIVTPIFESMMVSLAAPFWGPVTLVEDNYRSPGQFATYPYEAGLGGFMVSDLTAHEPTYPWSLRLRSEYANDFDDLSRFGGNLLWESAGRFGLDTSLDYRREALDPQRIDDLWTGDVNLVFRFAQSERLMMRTGLGMNWLSDSVDSDFGFNFTYGGDWFPRKPWVISSTIDWGTLGHAALFHGRATVGVNYRRWEVYTGYDYYDVGGAHINGFVTGIRFWY